MESDNLFGYVQYDIEILENHRETFVTFPPKFKNINFGRDDIGPFMKENAEKEGLLTQTTRMLISSCFLGNATNITQLLLFYLDLGHVRKKIVALCNILQ